jgi:hypothetical protein
MERSLGGLNVPTRCSKPQLARTKANSCDWVRTAIVSLQLALLFGYSSLIGAAKRSLGAQSPAGIKRLGFIIEG